MKIIESFIKGKKDEKSCEDILFVSDDYIAVIDGVTSKSDFSFEGRTTGKLAAEIIRNVLSSLPKDATVDQFLDEVNQEICAFYEKVEFPYSRAQQGLQAVCVVYSNHYRQIWTIGDCQSSIDQKSYMNPKASDDILAEMRSLVLNIVRAEDPVRFTEPAMQKMARELIEPWILRATIFANSNDINYGYAIINGQEIPKSLVKIILLDDNEHEVILTSDGYPEIRGTLEESEAYLQNVLTTDRECCNLYHSTKGVKEGCCSFDDRTYIRFTVDRNVKN